FRLTRPPLSASGTILPLTSSTGSSSHTLSLNPRQNISFAEAPVFAETKARNSFYASTACSVVHPAHGHVQQFRHFFNREQVFNSERCWGAHNDLICS